MISHLQCPASQAGMPVRIEPQRGHAASLPRLVAWASEHRAQLLAPLETHGAVLLRGFRALDGAAAFEQLLTALCPQLMDYVGGTAPRTVVSGRILTSTDLPPAYTLALHQGRLDAGLRARFERRGLQVRRTLPNRASLAQRPGIPKSWESVFQTDDPRQVDAIAAERGWAIEWLANGSLLMWQEPLPAFRVHGPSGASVWFNQAHYHTPRCTLLWARRDGRDADAAAIEHAMRERPDMLDRSFHRDGEPVDDEDAGHIWDTLVASEQPFE